MPTKTKSIREKMQSIPDNIISEWKGKMKHGDIVLIATAIKVRRERISDLINNRRGAPSLIKSLTNYFKKL